MLKQKVKNRSKETTAPFAMRLQVQESYKASGKTVVITGGSQVRMTSPP